LPLRYNALDLQSRLGEDFAERPFSALAAETSANRLPARTVIDTTLQRIIAQSSPELAPRLRSACPIRVWNGIFAAGDRRLKRDLKSMSPRRDRKSETTTRQNSAQKRPFYQRAAICEFRETGWWATSQRAAAQLFGNRRGSQPLLQPSVTVRRQRTRPELPLPRQDYSPSELWPADLIRTSHKSGDDAL
jgi:hypothetical protein